jgi:hypothetical protein
MLSGYSPVDWGKTANNFSQGSRKPVRHSRSLLRYISPTGCPYYCHWLISWGGVRLRQSVEWKVAGETEVLQENLPQCHFVHHTYHMTWSGLEAGDRIIVILRYCIPLGLDGIRISRRKLLKGRTWQLTTNVVLDVMNVHLRDPCSV